MDRCCKSLVFLAFSLLVVASPRDAGAAAPFAGEANGRYRVDLPSPPVYDLTGTYREYADPFDLVYTLVQDANGRLTGTGEAQASLLGFDFDISFTIAGKVKGSARGTKIAFKMDGSGIASDGFEEVPFKFTSSVKTQITSLDPARMIGTIAVKVCARGAGCGSDKLEFEALVPDDGSWGITLLLAPGAKGLVGDATVFTDGSDGSAVKGVPCTVTGKIGKNGIAKLKLKPVNGGKPFTLSVRVAMQEDGTPVPEELIALKGALLGHKVKA